MRRFGPVLVVSALLLFAGTSPAPADDIPPPVFPSGLSSPSDVGNDAGGAQTTPGPTYEITPGSAGTELPAPEDAQVRDARAALDRLSRKPASQTRVAAPTATEEATASSDGTDWWLIGSGLLVLLILTEVGRVNLAGAQHKRRTG